MKKLFSTLFLVSALGWVFSQPVQKEVLKENLNPAITSHISATYPSYQINNTFQITDNGVVTYKVKVNNKGSVLNLYYDAAFNFVKQEAVSSKDEKSKGKGKNETKTKEKPKEKLVEKNKEKTKGGSKK